MALHYRCRRKAWYTASLSIGMLAIIGATVARAADPAPALTASAITAVLVPSVDSPQNVGVPVTWTALASGGTARFIYRFSVSYDGQPFRVVRDYSSSPTLVWAPLDEGYYVVRVTVREGFGRAAATTVGVPFVLTSAVATLSAAAAGTGHPLVALYSAPPCVGLARAGFRPSESPVWQYTNWKTCLPGKSVNFHVAGMRASTLFALRHQTWDGVNLTSSAESPFRTDVPTVSLPTFAVTNVDATTMSLGDDVLFHSMLPTNGNFFMPIATDLSGRVIHYLDKRADWGYAYPTRLVTGGSMVIIARNGSDGPRILESDLLGNTLRETNMARVNEQLTEMGVDNIRAFHHDATRFPNGHTLVLGMIERLLPGRSVPTMGDLVIDLDQNFQVTWTWNAFDHLDPNRGPVLGETCAVYSYACPGSSPNAVDWLHSNSVNSSPADGNLVISMRHQDWVIKVRYQNGFGDGEVLWRLGPEGDFTLVNGSGEFPWNSHQHDAIYVGPNRIALYDNGNTRCRGAASGTCNSRGQVYELDEASGLAIQVLNADLGVYSDRLGSAEILTNGNYFFGSGAVSWDPASGDATEVTPDGAISYTQRVQDQFYRSKRFKSLYTP